MSGQIDAGSLNQRVEVLELQETVENTWEWVPVRKVWAQVRVDGKRNLFSSIGIGARNGTLILRKQNLTLHHALLWNGKHLFLTSITDRDRMYLDVSAAVVSVTQCVSERLYAGKGTGNRPEWQHLPPVSFPGVLTEKYVRYEEENTYGKSSRSLVLITPKEIVLREGDLVRISEGLVAAEYNVQAAHLLDEYKNEYEILYSRDV